MNGACALYYLNLNFQAPWPLFNDLSNNVKNKFQINLGQIKKYLRGMKIDKNRNHDLKLM